MSCLFSSSCFEKPVWFLEARGTFRCADKFSVERFAWQFNQRWSGLFSLSCWKLGLNWNQSKEILAETTQHVFLLTFPTVCALRNTLNAILLSCGGGMCFRVGNKDTISSGDTWTKEATNGFWNLFLVFFKIWPFPFSSSRLWTCTLSPSVAQRLGASGCREERTSACPSLCQG